MAVYACTDLHGRYDLYLKILELLKPEDTVYFLGDACDRGPDGWKLVKAILTNPQFIYLKGNHEDLLVKACSAYSEDYGWDYETYNLWSYNGGVPTAEAWELDEHKYEWLAKIKKLPLLEYYHNENNIAILLSHAGFTPKIHEDGSLEEVSEHDLLWDRKHFLPLFSHWEGMENVLIVHGHTVIKHLKERLMITDGNNYGAYWYCNNHKVCIDNGSAFSGACCLLDLNSFDEHIIY